MAKAKSYAYTDLSQDQSMIMVVDGVGEFKVSQFTAQFALNDIPKASCMIAVGRDVRNPTSNAFIHLVADQLKQMRKAQVYLLPQAEWDPSGTEWPGSSEIIFDGYYVGMAYRKISGKIQPVLHLVHWLVDLAHSSTLSQNQHPSNPTSLVHPAVVPSTKDSGGAGPPIYVSHHVGHEDIVAKLNTDLWEGIKTMLCELAEIDKFEVVCGAGLGSGDKRKNDKALTALRRIQGPATKCDKPYDPDYGGRPLVFQDNGVSLVKEAIGDAVTNQTMQSFASTTFWDKLISDYLPMFGMAIVPQVEIATVIADTPGLGGADNDSKRYDKLVRAEDYDNFDLSAMITRPLQGVGVYGDYESLTKIEITESGRFVCVGGHFAVDSLEPGDGMWLVVKSPPWLRAIHDTGLYAGGVTGIKNSRASNSATTPGKNLTATDLTPGQALAEVSNLYDKYARTVYVSNMLRGRGASVHGKLRFDIAPGSIVKIESKPEIFSEGVDELATPLYGHVARVTININAEGQRAGTSLQFTHIRTEQEFLGDERTFVDEHPLFGSDVYVGSPLIANYKFPYGPAIAQR